MICTNARFLVWRCWWSWQQKNWNHAFYFNGCRENSWIYV